MDSAKASGYRWTVDDLKALIGLAVDNNLSLLEIGDVKIVPSTRRNSEPEGTLQILKTAEQKAGRRLSAEEMQDEILFGPGGSVRVADDAE